MKFIDLFAGIGGFRYGIEKSNIQDNTSRDKFQCVYSNEWDKYAAQIYKKHFGEIDTRDITTVDASEIPDHDLLCAGFPCQAFSVAGKRLGFDDTRGTLFFEIARIAKQKRPRYLLLENVKGLLSHDKGKTFQTILGVLADLGYRVEWQVLNSKYFGVPQTGRECSLSDILEEEVDEKYFLLKEQQHRIWFKRQRETYDQGFKQGKMPYPDNINKPARSLTAMQLNRNLHAIPSDTLTVTKKK